MMEYDEKKILERVIKECEDRLPYAGEDSPYDFDPVNLISEFWDALNKYDRSDEWKRADVDKYFTEGARELFKCGEAFSVLVSEDGRSICCQDWEGNQRTVDVRNGQKIEAQDMEYLLTMSFPCLSRGLSRLPHSDHGWRIDALYGYDYFLCGADILLRGTRQVCDHALEIIRALGVKVDARPLDKAWLIYEPDACLLDEVNSDADNVKV